MSRKKSENTDVMVLGAAHSLMVSNVPEVVSKSSSLSSNFFKAAKNFEDKSKLANSVESLGLFGGTLNVNSFMPEVTPEMLVPKDSDFIEPMFRLLTATTVAAKFNPTEFSDEVLKESMFMLLGQTVNLDHETDVGNAVGAVKSVEWQDSYKDESGVVIPAGINGILKIDGLSNPRIARGIMMDPPSIHSNSVTVEFNWKPSHDFEDLWEFYNKLGSYTEDGELVRRIATKIISYKETSLVWHGADPFAQVIKSGKLNNPNYAGSQYQAFSEEKQAEANTPTKRVSMFDFKGLQDKSLNYNTSKYNNVGDDKKEPHNNSNNDKNMDKELQELLESLFGKNLLTLSEGKDPSAEEALNQIKALVTLKETQNQELKTLKDEVATLKDEVSKYTASHANWGEHVKSFREETVASYKKVTGEKVDENILALLEGDNTTFETLQALRKTYDTQLEDKFPLKCSSCGSHDVSRASSLAEGEGSEEPKENKGLSVEQSVKNLADKKLK